MIFHPVLVYGSCAAHEIYRRLCVLVSLFFLLKILLVRSGIRANSGLPKPMRFKHSSLGLGPLPTCRHILARSEGYFMPIAAAPVESVSAHLIAAAVDSNSTSPDCPFMRIRSPERNSRVSGIWVTAGIPASRSIIEAWESSPPT